MLPIFFDEFEQLRNSHFPGIKGIFNSPVPSCCVYESHGSTQCRDCSPVGYLRIQLIRRVVLNTPLNRLVRCSKILISSFWNISLPLVWLLVKTCCENSKWCLLHKGLLVVYCRFFGYLPFHNELQIYSDCSLDLPGMPYDLLCDALFGHTGVILRCWYAWITVQYSRYPVAGSVNVETIVEAIGSAVECAFSLVPLVVTDIHLPITYLAICTLD